MILRPPRSTLFPTRRSSDLFFRPLTRPTAPIYVDCAERLAEAADEGGQVAHGEARLHRDRKSTRLNSSHTVISYAVFCLKKKKKNKTKKSTKNKKQM